MKTRSSLVGIGCLLIFAFQQACGPSETNRQVSLEDREDTLQTIQPEFAESFFLQEDLEGKLQLHWRQSPDGAYFIQSLDLADCQEEGPYDRVVVMGAPYVGFLDHLGLLDKVIGVESKSFIYNETLRQRIDSGLVTEVGLYGQADIELILSLEPDLVIFSVNGSEADAQAKQFRQLGVPAVGFGEWREAHPLGRAEWIKVFGHLFCKQEEANQAFLVVKEDYFGLRDSVEKVEKRVLTGAPYQGVWYVPRGRNVLYALIEDAGGAVFWPSEGPLAVRPLDIETVLKRAQDADVWLNVGQFSSLETVQESYPALAQIKAVQKRQVFNHSKFILEDGAEKYYELSSVRPDLLLWDIRSILIGNTDSLNFYQPLAQ